MLGATGRTAILMSILGVGVLVWAWMLQQGPRVALAMGWAGLVGGLAAFGLAFALTDELLKLMGRSGDLTGRTEIWDVLRNIAQLDPIKGLGYQSFWRGEYVMTSPYQWIIDQTGFTPANAHNSWLDAQVQLGLVGLGLLVASVGWCWMLALGRLRNGGMGAAFALSTLSALTLISFSETILLNPIDFQWFLLVMIAAKLALGDEPEALSPLSDADRLDGRMEGDTWTFRPPGA
jgi:O-antigen ligase